MTFLCQHRDLNLLLRTVVMFAFHSLPPLLLLTPPPFHMKYLTTEDSADCKVNMPTPHLMLLIPCSARPARHPGQVARWCARFPNRPPTKRQVVRLWERGRREGKVSDLPSPPSRKGAHAAMCSRRQDVVTWSVLVSKPMMMPFPFLKRASWGHI